MRIVIPGDPIAKARPRFSHVGKFVKTYDPQSRLADSLKGFLSALVNHQKTNDFEACFRLPLSVSLSYQMPIAKNDTMASKNAKLWGFEKPSHKPDIDNLIKWTADIANGILWRDDAQIVHLTASQCYSSSPCTIIEINPIPEIQMTKEHEIVFKTFSPDDIINLLSDTESMRCSLWPNSGDDKDLSETELAATADVLIEFAKKWTDKLKKIKGK